MRALHANDEAIGIHSTALIKKSTRDTKMTNCNDYWQHADYLPLDLVITYWCEQSGFNAAHCRDAKKSAILAAITSSQIKFRRSDGKPFQDDIYTLAANHLLLIERDSFNAWATQFANAPIVEKPLSERERQTLLNIIGVLLELIQTPKTERDSEAKVIKEMVDNYPDKQGISKRTLEEKFAAAKKSLLIL